MLGAFGDGADGGLEVELGGMDFDFFSGGNGAEAGHGVSGVGDAQLAALGERGHAGLAGVGFGEGLGFKRTINIGTICIGTLGGVNGRAAVGLMVRYV